jgi:DNA-directed RNA polymerase subunit RPC12/RpoP
VSRLSYKIEYANATCTDCGAEGDKPLLYYNRQHHCWVAECPDCGTDILIEQEEWDDSAWDGKNDLL